MVEWMDRSADMQAKGPTMESENVQTVISVLGKDRPGIVATVATTLAEFGANIDDIHQTVMDGMFTMTMLVTLDGARGSFNAVQEALAADGEKLGLQIRIQRQDIFDAMYSI